MSGRWSCKPTLVNVNAEQLFTPKNQSFCGIKLSQTWSALLMLENVLASNRNIMRIVELGTGCGGLTLFFGLHMVARKGKVLTFDTQRRQDPSWHSLAKLLNITFEQKDVFEAATIQQVKSFINDGTALIYCDNGDKKREFPLYMPVLKKNDLIMVHDWNIEITPKHLDNETLSLLRPYRQDEFNALKTQILSMKKV